MKVLEIKNNLVKISIDDDEKLVLAGFVVVEDEKTPYVAQVVSLKADNGICYAIAKLMFTFDTEGIVKNYDGSIPSLNANVTKLSCPDLLDILPIETPLKIGNIAQQDFLLNVDSSILNGKLLICSDSAKNSSTIVENFSKQLENRAESSIIFDIDGKYDNLQKFVFGKDFKLPLNFETINFIYANDLNDVNPTSKAVIQDIFLEVQEYTRTIPDKYIPFDTFIEVVAQQYKESSIPELALLKNKLLKYKEENVFAQSKYEITSLKEYIKDNYSVVVDISNVDSSLQREIIAYVYTVLDDLNANIISFVKLNDANSDKKLLKILSQEGKIQTNIICNHNYKYVYELKEKANNLILFVPETTQHDFASYNTFLNKLNHDEFIVYGKSTQMIPLMVELAPLEIKKDEKEEVQETSDVLEIEPSQSSEPLEDTVPVTEEIDESIKVVPVSDFTENEDTYTDLSDDIERKPEEEDYSSIADNKFVEDEDEELKDNFDEELERSINSDVIVENQSDMDSIVLDQESDELAQSVTDDSLQTEEVREDIIMPDGEIIEQADIDDTIYSENLVTENSENDEEEALESSEFSEQDAVELEESLFEQTPFESKDIPQPAKLMPDDNDLNDELIAKVAKDIDDNFIYSKIEQDNLEDESDQSSLTEDDLNFIDDINHGEDEILEPVTDSMNDFSEDASESFESEQDDSTPIVPVYPADTPVATQSFEQGDHVSHPKYGEGVVEKMIKYGNKTLCSINFVNVGRRLLDPAISEISKM